MKILFFGDIVGSIGRKVIASTLPEWREKFSPDFVLANVENLSHGRGISAKTLLELDALHIDAYTSGNHVWENASGLSCFSDPRWSKRLIRPANIRPGNAGNGYMILEKNNSKILVINLLGNLLMKDAGSNPFLEFDKIISANESCRIVIVDFHAETTSEKEAFGLYVDGRASAVLGTHTHVPTADQKILPAGCGYVTDIGRNGGHHSVVGFEAQPAIQKFLHADAKAYDPQKSGLAEANAILVTIDSETGRTTAMERLRNIFAV